MADEIFDLTDSPLVEDVPSSEGSFYPIQKILPNLIPDTRYMVRVRSYNNFNVYSEWSDAIEFITPLSAKTPQKPNIQQAYFEVSTGNLYVIWSASVLNEDGSELDNLDYYEITFTSPDDQVFTDRTILTGYTLTFETNAQQFGLASPIVNVSIVAVNKDGAKSTTAASIEVIAQEPNTPTAPVVRITSRGFNIDFDFNYSKSGYLTYRLYAIATKEYDLSIDPILLPSDTITPITTINSTQSSLPLSIDDIAYDGSLYVLPGGTITGSKQQLSYYDYFFKYRVVDRFGQESDVSPWGYNVELDFLYPAGNSSINLYDLYDVKLPSILDPDYPPNDGYVLTYSDLLGKWTQAAPTGGGGGGATNLDGLTDVVITSATPNQTLEYNGTNWVNTTPKSSTIVSATKEPIGHEDITKSTISFNESTMTFSISPVSGSHYVWCAGTRYTKSSTETVTIPDVSGLYYICYNSSGTLIYQTTYFEWDSQTPTAYVYWNADDNKAYFFADERHGVTLDWATHEYLHRTRGAAIANGFGAGNYTIAGNGSSNTHAQLDIANGTFFDEDLQVDITHASSPTANTWQQFLQGPAKIPIFYRSETVWKRDTPTNYPLKQGTTRAQYNLNTSGTWSSIDISANGKYGVSWIVATNNLTYPVLAILGQDEYVNQGDAESTDWSSLDLTGFPIFEFRPLYKVIYQTANTYSNTPKSRFTAVLDLRQAISNGGGVTSTPVSDHGSLTGLSDDDHTQYLNQARHDALDHTTAMSTVVLDDISDVTMTTLTNGDVLRWDSSTSVWKNNKAVANSPRYTFSTTTTDSDPGTGIFRYDNSTFASVSYIYIDNNDSAGSRTSWYDTFDDSTSVIKGYLYFTSIEGHQNIFAVNGSVTVASGYYKIPVTPITGSVQTDGLIFYLMFIRNGDKGPSRSISTVTSNTTAGSANDTDYVYIVTGAYTVTMPSAMSNTNRYSIKNGHSAAITVNTTLSQTIDGSSSISIAAEDSVDLISDNSNWRIL